MNHEQRIQIIRTWLKENAFDAFIVPHEDEFLSEYIPLHHERLHWLTGFTGSAGMAIVTKEHAAIFVDGRYTVQVKKQVPEQIFEHRHFIEEPGLEWLRERLQSNSKVAIDLRLHSANWLVNAQEKYSEMLNFIAIEHNPIDHFWHDRPSPNFQPIRLMPLELVGQSSDEKRMHISQHLTQKNVDLALLTQLDSICWLLNIRGSDILRFPVLLSTALIEKNGQVHFFIDKARLPNGFSTHVGSNVVIHHPNTLAKFLQQQSGKKILVDPQTSNAWFSQILNQNNAILVHDVDPCALLKAAKNTTEIQGMRNCHIRDGIAVTRFLAWLDHEVNQGRLHDEAILADKLYDFRKQDKKLVDLSFDTISAAGENAAMCHYRHQDQATPGQLKLNNVYLVDSGGQYTDGTTDITRTIAIGECNDEIKKTFTLVLKGHIALASVHFAKGTTGSQLDALARQYLWAHGYDYDHGTGHGVGHFLSVHEGPQRISKVGNTIALQPGMVLSNEPGYYRANQFGIRIENLEVVTEQETQGDSSVLRFDALTRAPIDVRLIEKSLLTDLEIIWLNTYHQKVWQDLHLHLEASDKAWLQQATAPI